MNICIWTTVELYICDRGGLTERWEMAAFHPCPPCNHSRCIIIVIIIFIIVLIVSIFKISIINQKKAKLFKALLSPQMSHRSERQKTAKRTGDAVCTQAGWLVTAGSYQSMHRCMICFGLYLFSYKINLYDQTFFTKTHWSQAYMLDTEVLSITQADSVEV